MKILYNQDGSVAKIELSDYVNQNSNNVDKVYVGIIGKEPSEYVATAYFTLPDFSTNFLPISTQEDFTIGDDTTPIHGKSFYLTNQQTKYAGVLSMSIEFVNAESVSQRLFTYNTKFTINPSNLLPDETNISLSEYNNIVQSLAGKIETSPERVDAVDSGITSAKVSAYDEHISDTTIHVTAQDKTKWNGKTKLYLHEIQFTDLTDSDTYYLTIVCKRETPLTALSISGMYELYNNNCGCQCRLHVEGVRTQVLTLYIQNNICYVYFYSASTGTMVTKSFSSFTDTVTEL